MTRFWPFAVRVFQSTPSARRATIAKIREQDTDSISIHALREEGDAASAMTPLHTGHFNPRSPWGERPKVPSTPSLALSYFNPRPPRGGRPGHSFDHFRVVQISIHALREEGDLRFNFRWSMLAKFQSTPSARRATTPVAAAAAAHNHFNPRPPRGERPFKVALYVYADLYFNPRPPRGGRRDRDADRRHHQAISIHALREEGDTRGCTSPMMSKVISIHALREESDVCAMTTPISRV